MLKRQFDSQQIIPNQDINRKYNFIMSNTQQLQIQEKQKTVEKLKQLISSLQDDLEVLSLEKVVQQDEYNTVTTEWKQKQEQVDFNFIVSSR